MFANCFYTSTKRLFFVLHHATTLSPEISVTCSLVLQTLLKCAKISYVIICHTFCVLIFNLSAFSFYFQHLCLHHHLPTFYLTAFVPSWYAKKFILPTGSFSFFLFFSSVGSPIPAGRCISLLSELTWFLLFHL